MYKNKKELLNGIENLIVSSKKIANNTLEIHYKNGNKTIRLHSTNIITFLANSNIELNSGGWKSHTTKSRINEFLPFGNLKLYQSNHLWYLGNYNPKEDILFYDGIILNHYGKAISKIKKPNIEKINKIKKRIKKYVNLIDKLDKIPLPQGGDCWYCHFRDTKSKQPLGDLTNSSHLQSHLKENYIFGSIILNAVIEAGFKMPLVVIKLNMKNRIKRALRKYLVKRLILNTK